MPDFIKTQNSFSNGEVAPEFYAHDNINGLSKLENMDVLAGGGLTRRDGLVYVDTLPGSARLLSFTLSDGQEYIIALTDSMMFIYRNGTRISQLATPWNVSDIANVQYAQRFGTMIFVHPKHSPRVLSESNGVFNLSTFGFARNDANLDILMPYVRFDDSVDITITVTSSSSSNNHAVFTTNRNFWTEKNVGGRFKLIGKQWRIMEYHSPTEVVAYVNGTYSAPSDPVTDWLECAFSERRGWPCSITFHQDRLVFGGSPAWPGGIWMSQVGKHSNFDTGSGLDDEAIFLSLLSQQRQQICTVVSSDNLQILTDVGEWAISSKPLTPSSVDIKQHTSVGSYSQCYLRPQKIEDATVFISNNGHDIRELSLDDLGEKYNAIDLCAFSKHMIQTPMDVAYNAKTRQMFIVRQDGIMAVLNQNAALGISAWATYKTQGNFLSVAVCNTKTYVAVERENGVKLEFFDSNALNDSGQYNFMFTASSLPLRISHHNVNRVKMRKVIARILKTKSIYINQHRITLPNEVYDENSDGHSGDVCMNLLGTNSNCMHPMWTIHGTEPYPVTILSVTMHGWYKI